MLFRSALWILIDLLLYLNDIKISWKNPGYRTLQLESANSIRVMVLKKYCIPRKDLKLKKSIFFLGPNNEAGGVGAMQTMVCITYHG